MELIPNYRLEKLLGESPQAKVYMGYFIHVPHRKLVIKILKSEVVTENIKRYFYQKIEHLKILKDKRLIIPLSYQEVMKVKFITRAYEPGMTLTQWMLLNKSISLEDFFKIAIQLADLIDKIHNAGIIHGGLKPNNILIDPQSLEVKIIDFITPFDVRNVSHFIYNPDFIRNTLSYTSPEQTGRINQRVEFTTDIYSLGVILYELLTGNIPFQARDPLEVIHSHLTEEVFLSRVVRPDIPKILGRIIEKTLQKQPEKRYQKGFGLASDLGKCKKLIAEGKSEEVFSLGAEDHSHRVTFISKMVGRNKEVELILKEYNEVANGEFRSLMISGVSGIGKTRLIQELQKPIIKSKGYFTSGKFDVHQKNMPYSSLIQAFRNLIRTFLTESDERVSYWKHKIQTAVGTNGSLLTDIVPELLVLIGPQPEVPKLSPMESRNRFNLLFGNFLESLASRESPLVLFIDDLQWCDLASFEFLTNIFLNSVEHPYLYIIGAYRHNEVDESHPLMKMIAIIMQNNKPLNEIRLGPVLSSDTHEMVSYILDEPMALTRELGMFLHELTGGNPLFVSESLSYLYNEGLLYFNTESKEWKWNIEKIRDSNMPLTVVGLFSSKVQQFPLPTIELLEFCACMGNLFLPNELALIKEIPLIEVFEILRPVLSNGLLIENKDQFQFIHDKVQEATLLQISSAELKKIHWQIGKHLYTVLPPLANLEKVENIFTILSHLNMAYKLGKEVGDVLNAEEKLLLARLNYHGGNSALNLLATVSANEYYLLSKELLENGNWEAHYELTYRIFQKLAKTELMVGRFENSEKLINELLSHARSDLDKAEALAEQTASLSSFGNFKMAIETANKGLSYFGKSIPDDGLVAREKCKKLLQEIHSRDEDIWQVLLEMPFTNDRKNKVELAFYSELIPDLYMSGLVDQLYLSAAQSTQLCLNGGMDESVIYSFSIMGLNLGEQEQFEAAFKYEDLAKNLCERYPNTFGATRGMNGVVWCNMHSRSHPGEIVNYCLKCIQSGKNCGDLYNAGLSYGPLLWNLQVKGTDFFEIEKYANECFEFSKKFQLSFSVALSEAMTAGWILPMQKTYTPGSMEEKIKTWESQNHIAAIGSYYVHRALTSYYCGRYEEAEIFIENVKIYLHGLTDNVLKRQWYVLKVLNEIRLCEAFPHSYSKEEVLNKISPLLVKIQKWAELGPLLRPYLKFALAEKRRFETGLSSAWSEYFKALEEAHTMEYTFLEGFIYESLAVFAEKEFLSISRVFVTSALNHYQACHAERKIYALYEQFHQVLSSEDLGERRVTEVSTPLENQNIKDIDDFYFIKASQAISAEMDKEHLLKESIKIFTDSTGAQYGIITLVKNGELAMFADYLGQGKNKSKEKITELDSNILGLLRYVQRTKDLVLINNKNRSDFYQDFIDLSEIKALLCLPIVKNNNVLAIIYLESKVSDSVFTPKEVEMVKLLSLQTGITLENVELYEEVKKENIYRKEMEEALLKAKNRADEANASKSRFLANMSHEIRTPLNSIIGVTDCLLEGNISEDQHHLLSVARVSSENLLHIINDILDISRIESGDMSMEKIPLSLKEEIQYCIEMVSMQAKEKNINIESQVSSEVEDWRLGDPIRLRQVLVNLLNNAIKFSTHGTVSVKVTKEVGDVGQPNLLFSVADQGIGIPKEKIDAIFDRFRQADESMTRRFGGSGLGLTISKKIVELMNGKIWVESEVGKGSVFKFKIYLPVDEKKQYLKIQETWQKKKDQDLKNLTEEKKPKELNLLLVDDSQINHLIFKRFLSHLPHHIESVEDGQKAVDAFLHGKFDLIFMDIQMPIMDGYTATQRIRSLEKENHLKETPIIAFTAHAFEEDVLASKEAGCDDHIVKPLKKEVLLSILDKYSK
ncbi:MAG: AAA family ATPase [Pseudobdellovibrionaceae bacterium]